MSLVREKYAELAPRGAYLSDVVVLAQAWKKAHSYIRKHNWYADTLELDCSAVGLEGRLQAWATEGRSHRHRPRSSRRRRTGHGRSVQTPVDGAPKRAKVHRL